MPRLPSVKQKLSSFNPSDHSVDGTMGIIAMMGASDEVMAGMQRKHAEAKEESKQHHLQMIEMIKTMELPLRLTSMAKHNLGRVHQRRK